MSDQTLTLKIKVNLPIFLGVSVVAHVLFLMFFAFNHLTNPTSEDLAELENQRQKAPIMVTVGEPNSKNKRNVFYDPTKKPALAQPEKKAGPHKLDLHDLMAPSGPQKGMAEAKQPVQPKVPVLTGRPGTAPAPKPSALQGIKYGAADFKDMRKDPMFAGGSDIVNSERVSLNFEVPEGKKLDELNESQLKLYGFLRRGAMKYVNSLSAEIKEFELKNPHLHFPLVDTAQTLTGRLVYDNQGNLKQIKMVRWSNNDKLQGFFENVLKRLENLQNPPKELWAESGEFTVFVTLQING